MVDFQLAEKKMVHKMMEEAKKLDSENEEKEERKVDEEKQRQKYKPKRTFNAPTFQSLPETLPRHTEA